MRSRNKIYGQDTIQSQPPPKKSSLQQWKEMNFLGRAKFLGGLITLLGVIATIIISIVVAYLKVPSLEFKTTEIDRHLNHEKNLRKIQYQDTYNYKKDSNGLYNGKRLVYIERDDYEDTLEYQ